MRRGVGNFWREVPEIAEAGSRWLTSWCDLNSAQTLSGAAQKALWAYRSSSASSRN